MDDAQVLAALQAAEAALKQTTAGYLGHPSSWYSNTTTNWYKALSQLDQAVIEMAKRVQFSVTTPSGTAQSGKALTATIKAAS